MMSYVCQGFGHCSNVWIAVTRKTIAECLHLWTDNSFTTIVRPVGDAHSVRPCVDCLDILIHL